MKPLVVTPPQWDAIVAEIRNQYPPSIFIRSKMKEKLGFTTRLHYDYETFYDSDGNKITDYKGSVICLDFFCEKKRTLFLLKYSDILHDRKLIV